MPLRVLVTYHDGRAEPLHHVVRHSPDGFEWGYAGSGPADLALSIVTAVAPEHAIPSVYQAVKEVLIAPLPPNLDWQIQATTVLDVIARVLGGEPEALAGLALSTSYFADDMARAEISAAVDKSWTSASPAAKRQALDSSARSFDRQTSRSEAVERILDEVEHPRSRADLGAVVQKVLEAVDALAIELMVDMGET